MKSSRNSSARIGRFLHIESQDSCVWRLPSHLVQVIVRTTNIVTWVLSITAIVLYVSAGYLHRVNDSKVKKYPNVIFIMVDTLRADHLGCYGYQRNTTPNIDEFAKHRIRAERTVSQASWTTCSVASFMTSRYPQCMNLGDVCNPGSMDSKFTTLADAGYAREASNKWISKVKDRRFFLFALFMDCHAPYYMHSEYNFDPGYKGKIRERAPLVWEDWYRYSKRDIEHTKAMYNSEIAYTDRYVGKLLEDLKQQGQYDNSLIILLSDHGEEFKEHGDFEHGHTLYNEVTTVPFIVKLPHKRNGRVLKGTFSLIDVLP